MLRDTGFLVHEADLTATLRVGAGRELDRGPAGPGTLVVHVNGPMMPWAMFALGRRTVADKRVVGNWVWEVPRLPPDWDPGFQFVHEIWAPSQFAAAAMRRPGGPKVQVLTYPLNPSRPAPLGRGDFGLPSAAFVAINVFAASSSLERKNPLAAVRAFRRAFGDRPDRLLMLKTLHTGQGGQAWADLLREIEGAPNIRVIDAVMGGAEVQALIACADCLLSLHRAEGYGLPLAEARALGVPVIATGWSGNLDFMSPDNSVLVPFRMIPAVDRENVFTPAQTVWAEPEIEAAAAGLRMLAEDPVRRHAIAAAGRATVQATLSASVCTGRVRDLLGCDCAS
ncbi:MAG: glycosyltransferase family 4 protein [Rhodopila sp.]